MRSLNPSPKLHIEIFSRDNKILRSNWYKIGNQISQEFVKELLEYLLPLQLELHS
jgi:N6-adenosine-specific RNA methylase IME4